MRKVLSAALFGAALLVGSSANAQSWGLYIGNGASPYHPYRDYDDRLVTNICSGQRAHALESRLRHEEDEDEIDGYDARRIHFAIDQLEDKQRHECEEGDRRAIYDIANRYRRIGRWIDGEAHGDWRRGW